MNNSKIQGIMKNIDKKEYPSEDDHGKKELVEKYNINDQAHLNSSKEDFVDTVSNFHHAKEDDTEEDDK